MVWAYIATAFVVGWCAGWVFLGLFGPRIADWYARQLAEWSEYMRHLP